MDAYYNLLVVFNEDISLDKANRIVIDGINSIYSSAREVTARYNLPKIFEYENCIYENDFSIDDLEINEYTSPSWFSVFFYSELMDGFINSLSIRPSNQPGQDFIIHNYERLALYLKGSSDNIIQVIYSVDCLIRDEEIVKMTKAGGKVGSINNILLVV